MENLLLIFYVIVLPAIFMYTVLVGIPRASKAGSWDRLVDSFKKAKRRQKDKNLTGLLKNRKRMDNSPGVTEFRWEFAQPDVSASDFFYHLMMGLEWPKVTEAKIVSSYLGNVKITLENSVSEQVIWIFTSNIDQFKLKNKDLLEIVEQYRASGISNDAIQFETTRRIVENVRMNTIDELRRYGFCWE